MKTLDISTITDADFDALPIVVEGESKIVRELPAQRGLCIIKFKPTIYSFTANRAGTVPGSDTLRLRASKVFTKVLKDAGISHTYEQVTDRFVLSRRVDATPIEVVVKAFHSGTSKHRYFGMDKTAIRKSHPFYAGKSFSADGGYPEPIVRFDWRNPLKHPETGKALPDEVLGEAQADWFINTEKARETALLTYRALSNFLGARDVVLYDLCLFITEDGEQVFGEISQDCGRFRHFDLGSLDKDEWRAGGSSEHVLKKWQLLLDIIER